MKSAGTCQKHLTLRRHPVGDDYTPTVEAARLAYAVQYPGTPDEHCSETALAEFDRMIADVRAGK